MELSAPKLDRAGRVGQEPEPREAHGTAWPPWPSSILAVRTLGTGRARSGVPVVFLADLSSALFRTVLRMGLLMLVDRWCSEIALAEYR